MRQGRERESPLGRGNSVVQDTRLDLLADVVAILNVVLAETEVRDVDRTIVEAADLDVETGGDDGGDETRGELSGEK